MKGVHLALADEADVGAAYDSVASYLGPVVLIERMAPPGVEIAIRAINGEQFGPYVTIGGGGVLIELVADRAVALAPIDPFLARRVIAGLRVSRLLDGWRGTPVADIGALADCFARISVIAPEHRDSIAEIDVNPITIGPNGCVAVDALVVRCTQQTLLSLSGTCEP